MPLPSTRSRNRKRFGWLESLETRSLLATLAISEINYEPYAPQARFGETAQSNNDFEFVEVFNYGDQPLNLQGLQFVQRTIDAELQGILYTFGADSLAAGERAVIVRDGTAFRTRYGAQVRILGVWDGGGLSNSGEMLTIVDAQQAPVFQVAYDTNSDWPTRANGVGATLEIVDVLGDSNAPENWRSSISYGGTPSNAPPVNREPRVLINEVLAHTDPPQIDTVELHNLTSSPIDISGWFFSDRLGVPTAYTFPAGSSIPANGYLLINDGDINPGGGQLPTDFSLSEFGERLLLLSRRPNGRPLNIEDYAILGPTRNGASVGNVSDVRAGGELVPLGSLTLGQANTGHRVADVVISEIQYHPTGDDVFLEFIELRNTTPSTIPLDGWLIDDAIDIAIPAGTTMDPGESLVLVAFNPANQALDDVFRTFYQIDDQVRLIGPWGTNNSGEPQSLSNAGEAVTLRSTIVDGAVKVFEMEDQVRYNDRDPWPLDADGLGSSLSRVTIDAYGNVPESWVAADPSPGGDGSVTNPTPWHNSALPEDVDNDGSIFPFDALLIINELNSRGSTPLPTPGPDDLPLRYIDVNADNNLSPIDALLVINWLNEAAALRTNLAATAQGAATRGGEDESLTARAQWLAASSVSSVFDSLITETNVRRRGARRVAG